MLPNKRLKLAGALVLEEVVGSCRTRDLRPPLLRRRAGRPQLKRDPLGSAIEMSYVVAIVAHPDFEPLIPLAERVHVWLADTSANRTRAQNYWRAHPQNSIEQGVTTFKVGVRDTAEQMVIGVLGPVDLHHGEHAHTPPWDTLEIYGAAPTPLLRKALTDFGISDVLPIPGGFRATRDRGSAV